MKLMTPIHHCEWSTIAMSEDKFRTGSHHLQGYNVIFGCHPLACLPILAPLEARRKFLTMNKLRHCNTQKWTEWIPWQNNQVIARQSWEQGTSSGPVKNQPWCSQWAASKNQWGAKRWAKTGMLCSIVWPCCTRSWCKMELAVLTKHQNSKWHEISRNADNLFWPASDFKMALNISGNADNKGWEKYLLGRGNVNKSNIFNKSCSQLWQLPRNHIFRGRVHGEVTWRYLYNSWIGACASNFVNWTKHSVHVHRRRVLSRVYVTLHAVQLSVWHFGNLRCLPKKRDSWNETLSSRVKASSVFWVILFWNFVTFVDIFETCENEMSEKKYNNTCFCNCIDRHYVLSFEPPSTRTRPHRGTSPFGCHCDLIVTVDFR